MYKTIYIFKQLNWTGVLAGMCIQPKVPECKQKKPIPGRGVFVRASANASK